MKTLLLNGCSFGNVWKPSLSFIKELNCERFVNISKPGTSFQRTCRSTIEWISNNGNPHFVLIPITFAHRWELALNAKEDMIDGSWTPLQNSNFESPEYNLPESLKEPVKRLVEDYYKIIPDIKTYWDKLFTEIIMLSGFLDSLKINHLLWDMCNGFDKKHLHGLIGFKKVELIEKNKKVINLWQFCGNRYMRETMSNKHKSKTSEFAYHHALEQYQYLEKYILDYIKNHAD